MLTRWRAERLVFVRFSFDDRYIFLVRFLNFIVFTADSENARFDIFRCQSLRRFHLIGTATRLLIGRCRSVTDEHRRPNLRGEKSNRTFIFIELTRCSMDTFDGVRRELIDVDRRLLRRGRKRQAWRMTVFNMIDGFFLFFWKDDAERRIDRMKKKASSGPAPAHTTTIALRCVRNEMIQEEDWLVVTSANRNEEISFSVEKLFVL